MIPSGLVIRDERPGDEPAIADVTRAAFATLAISRHTEEYIVAALRAADALTVSLVADLAGRVVGHIAFSPVTLSDGTTDWYGLGPLSVSPPLHRQGIGSALVREGLTRLQLRRARGCCVVGHPDYYRRLDFRNDPSLVHEGVPPEVFLVLAWDGRVPRGTVVFHEAFTAVGPEAGDAAGGDNRSR